MEIQIDAATPEFWVIVCALQFALSVGLYLILANSRGGESLSKDPRTYADKALHIFAIALGWFLDSWLIWLVWNHVVVHEFDIPKISFVSASLITFALTNVVTQPPRPWQRG